MHRVCATRGASVLLLQAALIIFQPLPPTPRKGDVWLRPNERTIHNSHPQTHCSLSLTKQPCIQCNAPTEADQRCKQWDDNNTATEPNELKFRQWPFLRLGRSYVTAQTRAEKLAKFCLRLGHPNPKDEGPKACVACFERNNHSENFMRQPDNNRQGGLAWHNMSLALTMNSMKTSYGHSAR